jgi:hypothetical protein
MQKTDWCCSYIYAFCLQSTAQKSGATLLQKICILDNSNVTQQAQRRQKADKAEVLKPLEVKHEIMKDYKLR